MKNFKQFISEKSNENEEDTKALKNLMGLNAGYSWVQKQTENPYTRGDVSWMIMKDMDQPSMAAHKNWNTDVGLAFDQDPHTGELYGDLAGFKAVHQRTKENRNVSFKPFNYEKYRQGLLQKLTLGLMGTPED